MTIKKKSEKGRIEIDLTGPEGNVFVLMGYAQRLTNQLELDSTKAREIIEDMQSSDYEHAVDVFEKNFGNYVTLYR